MRRVVFSYTRGWNDTEKEIHEFEDGTPDSVVEEAYVDWMISKVSDSCTWYDEGEGDDE